MFAPDELEGEVDHSFFDSDCDDKRNVGQKTMEEGLNAESQIPGTHKLAPAKPPEHLAGELSPGNERTETHLKQVEINKREHKTDISSEPNEAKHEGTLHSKRPSGAFLALLANMPNVEDNQRAKETGKAALAFTANSKKKNNQSLRKLIKNQNPQTVAPALNESSTDADSESSCSSQIGNSGSNLPKPTRSVRRKARGTRRGSDESKDLPNSSMDELDGSVTEVSPLSSPESGSLLSLGSQAQTERLEAQQKQESAPSSGFSNTHQEEDLNVDVDECSFRLESQLEKKLVLQCPARRPRKNYTFSRSEVRHIDHENQRLLQRLLNPPPGLKFEKKVRKKINEPNKSPVVYLPHSALNRQRQQRRIEQENLALLKRLESIKPSPTISRSKQLADYQRLAGYVASSSYSTCSSSSSRSGSTSSAFNLLKRLESIKPSPAISRSKQQADHQHLVGYVGAPSYLTYRSSSSRSSSTSSVLRSSRTVSSRAVHTNSSSTPAPSSSKLSSSRPAWY